MATTDPVRTTRRSTDPGQAMRSGGAILFAGGLLFVITIGFELRIGWPPPESETTLADVAAFMLQHWGALRWIWGAQMLGAFFFGLSALLLLQGRHLPSRWLSASVLWAAVAIGGIVATVAYGLALGSNPVALSSFEQNPEVFATVRGGVRFLLETGLATLLVHLVLFIWEGVATDGVVPRSWILSIAMAFVLAVLAAAVGLVRPPAVGVVVFLVPASLGLGLWRAGRRSTARKS